MYDLGEELIKSQVLCTSETQVIIKGADCSVYKIENETGEGVITRYPVFSGIEILYNDIHMTNGVKHNRAPRSNLLEINHCRIGRFECEFLRGGSIYLGEGDLAVNVMTNITNQTWFPLSHYHGITIAVDIPAAERVLRKLSQVMGKGLDFDLPAIRDRLCTKDSCFIMRATDSIQHIFSELYKVPQNLKDGYFKVKIIELFLFLNSPELVSKREERQYFTRKQIDKIKEIRQYLIDNVTQHITLNELSQQFNFPLTSMKLCFKEVYGSTINGYMQAYRVQMAAKFLRETTDCVTEIALKVGYQNSSKFAELFKQFMGQTPSEYRKSFVQ